MPGRATEIEYMTQEPVNNPLITSLSLLVRYGLGLNANNNELHAEVLKAADWALVYRYAAHGLAAVPWDGLSRLVQEGRVDVPKELKLLKGYIKTLSKNIFPEKGE